MMKIFLLFPVLLLTGCFATLPPKIVDHDVLVSIPCKVTLPAKPVMPLTDDGSVSDDIFVKSKKALAEIDIRKGYESELEAAADACSK
jgi:hypothetical protein